MNRPAIEIAITSAVIVLPDNIRMAVWRILLITILPAIAIKAALQNTMRNL